MDLYIQEWNNFSFSIKCTFTWRWEWSQSAHKGRGTASSTLFPDSWDVTLHRVHPVACGPRPWALILAAKVGTLWVVFSSSPGATEHKSKTFPLQSGATQACRVWTPGWTWHEPDNRRRTEMDTCPKTFALPQRFGNLLRAFMSPTSAWRDGRGRQRERETQPSCWN